jgi:hypothetical protein
MLGLGNLLTKSGVIKKFPNDFSFNFDGSNDYLDLNVGNGLISRADIEANGESFSAWIKLDNVSGTKYIVCHGKTVTENNAIYGGIYVEGTTAKFTLYKNSAYKTISGTTTLSAGTWYHIVGTYDGENNDDKMRIYINGSLEATSSALGGDFFTGEPTIAHIGRNVNTSAGTRDFYFDGLIDEVAIWDTALSADDVAKIGSKPVDLSKPSKYATDRTSNLKLWLRAGDKVLPENDTAIARQDFYTDFDGTDHYVSVADNDDLSFGDGSSDTPLSMCAWVYPIDSTKFMIFDKSDASNMEYTFQTDSGDNLGLALYDNTSGNYITRVSTDDLAQNVWSHVAVTYDGSGSQNNINVYINGKLNNGTASTAGTYVAMHNTSLEATIGRRTSDTSYANGKISNLSVYKTELDAQTISQMAKSRFTPMRDNRFSSVAFDGTVYIDAGTGLGTSLGDSYGNDLTISAWFKLASTGTTRGIFEIGDFSGAHGQINLWYGSAGKLAFRLDGGNWTAFKDFSDLGWNHVVAVYDASSESNSKVYLNGVDLGTGSGTFPSSLDLNGKKAIVGAIISSSYNWEGDISSVSVYNVAKTEQEIYALYQKGITYNESSETSLIAYYKMGDDTSKAFPTIADSSSNSNDGTITNGASDDIVQQMVAGYDLGSFESSSEELGAERVSEPSFASSTGWTLGTGWSISSNILSSDGSQSAVSNAGASITTSAGLYKVIITVDSISSGTIRPNLQSWGSYISTTGTHTQFFTLTGNNNLIIQASVDFVGSISFASVKEVLQSEVSDTYPAIIDVNEPVLGVELVDNNTTSGWLAYGNNTVANVTNGVKITHVDNAGGAQGDFTDAKLLNANQTSGKTYKVKFNAYYSGGTAPNVKIWTGAVNAGIQALTTSEEEYIIYFVNAGTASLFFDSVNGSQEIYILNLSTKEIQGNVGTMTNQAIDDLVYSSVLPDQSFLIGKNSAYNLVSLDGTNDYIDLPTPLSHTIHSIAFWNYKLEGGTQTFFSARDAANDGIFIRYTNNERINYRINNSTNLGTHPLNVSLKNKWYHIVCTYDGTTQKIYVDGDEINSQAISQTIDTTTNARIGARNFTSADEHIITDLGQFAFYNKALTSSEVSSIYNAGRYANLLDSHSDNLKLYYAFGALDAVTGLSDTTTTIYDRSGNSNHGTPVSIASTDLKSPPNAEPNGYAKGDTNRSTTIP